MHSFAANPCLRLVADGKVTTEVRTFQTVYWKPVWHILDDGELALVLANAAHVKNVPGRKTDINDRRGWPNCWRTV